MLCDMRVGAELDRLVPASVRPLQDARGGLDVTGGDQAEEEGAEEVSSGGLRS